MEPLLSKRQIQVLKKGRFIPYLYEEFGESDRKICDYLCEQGYMEKTGFAVVTTELGDVVLQNRRSVWFWRLAPIAISVAAFVKSFFG